MKKSLFLLFSVCLIVISATPSFAKNKKYKCKSDWIRMPAVVKSIEITASKKTWICFAEGKYVGVHTLHTDNGEQEIEFGFGAGKGGASAEFLPGEIFIIRVEDDDSNE